MYLIYQQKLTCLIIPNIDKETDNWECLKMAIGSENWYNLFDKSIWHYLVEINKHIPYDPVTEFPGIHPKGIFAYISEETCSIMFIEALFIVGKKPGKECNIYQ